MQHKGGAQKLHHPIEGIGSFPSSGSLDKRDPQGGEPRYNLPARPFRPVAGALARDTSLLQPFGLFLEPRGPLQVRGVAVEVLADGPRRSGLQGWLSLSAYGLPSMRPASRVQAPQYLLQAWEPDGSQKKTEFRGSERW